MQESVCRNNQKVREKRLNKNACSIIDLSARSSVQMGIIMENEKTNSLEGYMETGIRVIMFTILPLLAFAMWVIIVPMLLYGGVMTNVDDAEGILQTIVIFSAPMLLFMAVLPLWLQRKRGISREELGLKMQWNKKNMVILIVNSLFAVFLISKITLVNGNLDKTIPMVIQLAVIGVSEEILCRGIIFGEINLAVKNKLLSTIISSLIFAFLFHSGDSDTANLLIRLPLGLVLGGIRCYTGNIYNSVVMHIWYNTLMLIL